MSQCTSCGTRLSPEAFRCWLCHAAAPEAMEAHQADLPSNVTPMDHVWAGPLDRTRQHADPDPIAASILGRRGSKPPTFGQRLSGYVSHVLGRRPTIS
jgi:hypothetical protein